MSWIEPDRRCLYAIAATEARKKYEAALLLLNEDEPTFSVGGKVG